MSLYEENAAILEKRFPGIAAAISASPDCPAFEILEARSGAPTSSLDGVLHHSRYDPVAEARKIAAGLPPGETCLLYGFGLGYVAEAILDSGPGRLVIAIEPQAGAFKRALSARPMERLLSDERFSLLLGGRPDALIHALDALVSRDATRLPLAASLRRDKPFFEACDEALRRYTEKSRINEATLRRFGGLWVRNLARNWKRTGALPGIGSLRGSFAGVPALIAAAGPSLDSVLPRLKEIAERALVIAVDTSANAVKAAGVDPDFVVLVDPQYWNARHLDRFDGSASILVSESAAYPSAFRRPWRGERVCASIFPLGGFMEGFSGDRGRLGAGGSVATSAWDLARHMGCAPIYMAGLDLGYPGRATHAAGSLFERRAVASGTRLSPAESAAFAALTAAGPYPVPDNSGGSVLTDRRMALYAWWFESRMEKHPEAPTRNLSLGGVAIPGMPYRHVSEILALPRRRPDIDRILDSVAAQEGFGPGTMEEALATALKELGEIQAATRRALDAAMKAADLRRKGKSIEYELRTIEECDRAVMANPAKEVVSFLFAFGPEKGPGAAGEPETDPDPLKATKLVYERAARATEYHLKRLRGR
jgi:hypothetical protein